MIGVGNSTDGVSGGYPDVPGRICAHVGFLIFISIIIFVMCGFAGVVTWDDRYRVSPETLAKMSAAVAHRGPDGEGAFINHQEQVTADRPQVAMAFRRLAILDPDPRSNQPFTDGRFWLVFNGEIYNFLDLRKKLSSSDRTYQWKTTGDTEVLLRAYAVWGDRCVEYLNGMFAFAIWDDWGKSLFLARDRMGQKPLYMTVGFGSESFPATELRMDQFGAFPVVAFASEPGALLQLPWVDRTIDPFGLENYLRFGCTNWTIYASIGCIDPGQTALIQFQKVQERIYFDPNRGQEKVTNAEAIAAVRSKVKESVRRQLVSDVPLGVFLSGGVDSGVVAACTGEIESLQTFSIGFDDPRYDESSYAQAVADHLGTDHYIFRVTPRVADDLPKLAAAFGTPFADSSALPTYYLSREARKQVKVVLGGDGGDELFCGYDRYRAMQLGRRLQPFAAGPVRSLAKLAQRRHPKSTLSRAGRLIASLSMPAADRYESYMRLFDEPLLNELLLHPPRDENRRTTYPVASLYERFQLEGRDEVQAALAVDRISYLPDDLLAKVDRCSMLNGLEVRSPFMDHELVQFAARLTTDQLLKGGPKRMLREAFADDLPAWVFKRKKMGFAVPIGEWFRGELRGMLRDSLFAADSFASGNFNKAVVQRLVDEHEQERVDHSQRLYALLMLELWWNMVKKR